MATIAAKVSDSLARAVRRKARGLGKTESQVMRELLEEWVAPPSAAWGRAMLDLPRIPGPRRRRRAGELDRDVDTAV